MSVLLIAVSLMGGAFQKPLTYSCRAKLIGSALAELSSLSGTKLKASPDAASEVVLISVQNETLADLMPRIAEVTSCQWEQSGDGYTLKAAWGLQKKQADAELQAKAVAMRKVISARLEAIAKAEKEPGAGTATTGETGSGGTSVKTFTEAVPAETIMVGGSDGEVQVLQVLQAIDPTLLASVTGSRRLVWASNSPTNTQYLMPQGSVELIQKIIDEHNKNAAEVSASTEDVTMQDMPGMSPAELAEFRQAMAKIQKRSGPIKDPVAKALLIVQAQAFMGSEVHLKLFNAKGELLMDVATNPQLINVGGDDKLTQPPARTNLPPFELSPESAEAQKMLSSFTDSSKGSAPDAVSGSPALREKLSRTDLNDPLSFATTDVLNYYAAYKQKQIVADVPDDLAFGGGNFPMATSGTTVKTAEQAVTSVENKDVLNLRIDGGFLMVSPAHPAAARASRLPRKEFADLIAPSMVRGYISLDELAGYALNNPPLFESTVGTSYTMLFAPSLFSSSLESGFRGGLLPWNSLRFYASLDPTKREALVNGGSVPFSDLLPNQRELLASYLFSTEASFGGVEPIRGSQSLLRGMMFSFLKQEDAAAEPTELMPDGPVKGFISESAIKDQVLFLPPGNSMLSNLCLGPDEYGMMSAATAFAGAQGTGMGGFQLPKTARVGDRLNLEMIFHVGPKVGAHAMLKDVSVAKDAPYLSLDQLPASFQAAAQKSSEEFKKMIAAGGNVKEQGTP